MVSGLLWGDLWPIPLGILSIIIFLCLPDLRLRRARLKRWRWSPNAGLILFAVSLLAGLMATQIIISLSGSGAADIGSLNLRELVIRMLANYVGEVVVLLLVPGLVWGLLMARQAPEDPELVPRSWWQAVLSGIGSLALFLPLVMAVGVVVGIFVYFFSGQQLPEIAHGTLNLLAEASAEADAWFITVIILILLVTPVIEEVLYRGLLQEAIRRCMLTTGDSPWLAIIITSIIFALMHGAVVDLRGLIALFVLSLGFGWIYLKTGRLMASIVMHAGFNGVNLLQVLA